MLVPPMTTAPAPSISVVIPTYQRRDLVCEAVAAVCQCDYDGPFELIVVVDGSTDDTAQALSQLQWRFPLRVIEQENAGAAAARNRGAETAGGEILLFLDDDMMCEPDLLQQHAKMYVEHAADAVIGNTPSHPDSSPGFLSDSVKRWVENEQVRDPICHWDVFSGQLSVRRAVFAAIGGFDVEYTRGGSFSNEDADLGVKLLQSYTVRHNPEAISRQKYVVTPREYMGRAPKAVEGDLIFLRRHPQYSAEVLNARGLDAALGRYVYRPLARVPFVRRILPSFAVMAAEVALKTPLRSNRLLGRLYSGARGVAFWSAFEDRCAPLGRERILVLCYHGIEDYSGDPLLAPYGIPPEAFARQLDILAAAGYSFIDGDQLRGHLLHNAPLPKRPVLLTFDDGYQHLLGVARDVLKPRGIPAIVFVVTGIASRTNEWDQRAGARRTALLTDEDLRELAQLGVEVGSHSRSHREMDALDQTELREEASGSADDLQNAIGRKPRFFAYPFGSVNEAARKAVVDAGYVAAFGCQTGFASSSSDRFLLPRVGIFRADTPPKFAVTIRYPALLPTLARVAEGVRKRLLGDRQK